MNRGELGIPAYLSDRQVDYMATLFATAQVAGIDTDVLRTFCHDLASTRLRRASEGQGTKAAKSLAEWFPVDQTESKLFLSDAAWMFFNCEALAEPDEREAGDLLRNMGLDVRQIRVGSATRKGAVITREELENLAGQFAISEEHPAEMADAA